ncbi:MAG TPA: DUF4301 domain-containing protein [Acidobacteria bacterium]|nr:DUF4301 domain-containing protein [Acidobacteriota bacterium]
MPDVRFNAADLRQLAELGIDPEEAERQIRLFRHPPPFTRVLRPCTLGDGIRALPDDDHGRLLALHATAAREGRIGKLVPASGAASRMFKALLEDLHDRPAEPSAEVRSFLAQLPRFAFTESLAGAMRREGLDLDECLHRGDHRSVLTFLLTDRGLGYAELPKALLEFHRSPEGPRTPLEEHLIEAADHARDAHGACRLHLTVSPAHEEGLRTRLAAIRPRVEQATGARFEVSFSTQAPSTDTLAVAPDNLPFRQADGSLLFRPGGHGALIRNLQTLGRQGWDVVLLKNIDNVVPDHRKAPGLLWKKLLAGTLLDLQDRIFDLQRRLEESPTPPPALLEEAAAFLRDRLSRSVSIPAALDAAAIRLRLLDLLDRPLRVCGVVRNQGEPGGGPFWVEAPGGDVSLQIVEISQLDPRDPAQQGSLRAATHFNPVDLACALRDRHGRPYDLERFIDPATVFISHKSHEGRPLKALERPGLWNGAMAGWNTVFVEVPDATFAPVKTVLDLLRPEHLPADTSL